MPCKSQGDESAHEQVIRSRTSGCECTNPHIISKLIWKISLVIPYFKNKAALECWFDEALLSYKLLTSKCLFDWTLESRIQISLVDTNWETIDWITFDMILRYKRDESVSFSQLKNPTVRSADRHLLYQEKYQTQWYWQSWYSKHEMRQWIMEYKFRFNMMSNVSGQFKSTQVNGWVVNATW